MFADVHGLQVRMIEGTSYNRNGLEYFWELLCRLHIIGGPLHRIEKRLTENDCSELRNSIASFGERLPVVRFGHHLNKMNTCPGSFRLIRSPYAAASGIHKWYRFLMREPEAWTEGDTLNVPFYKSGGGVFGLGVVEEWFIQNLILLKTLGQDLFFRFESLKQSANELNRFLAAYNIHCSDDAVENAWQEQRQVDLAKGRQAADSSSISKTIEKHVDIIATSLKGCFGYDFNSVSSPQETWPYHALCRAISLFAARQYATAKKCYYAFDNDYSMFILIGLGKFVRCLPLLECQLSSLLFFDNDFRGFSKECLERHADGKLVYPRAFSRIVLSHGSSMQSELQKLDKLFNPEHANIWFMPSRGQYSTAVFYNIFGLA